MNKTEIKNLINRTYPVSNPVIFEIGCADGIDSQEFIDVFGNELILYCFEPDERNSNIFLNGGERVLKPNFVNPVSGCKLTFEKKAVGKIDGEVDFYQTNTIYSSSLIKPTQRLFENWPQIKLQEVQKVECVKLDTYVDSLDLQRIDFIWADVQGGEEGLIEGGLKTLNDKVRYFYTEYSKDEESRFYENSPDLDSLLKLLGGGWEVVSDFGSDVLLKNNKIL